jgi:hypothetical protein
MRRCAVPQNAVDLLLKQGALASPGRQLHHKQGEFWRLQLVKIAIKGLYRGVEHVVEARTNAFGRSG